MKKLFYTLIVLGTTLVTVAACSDEADYRDALDVEIVEDTKCNVIWVDVKGFSPQTDVPLGKGLYTRENAEEITKLDAWFTIGLLGTDGSERIDVSGGWEKQNGNYFFTVDTLEWKGDYKRSLQVTVHDEAADYTRKTGFENLRPRGSDEELVSPLKPGGPNRGEGCRPPAEEPEPLVENTTSEKSEPADENPLKAEFHLSEGDFCGFFFIDVFGLDDSKKPLGPSLTTTIDGKPAAGMWVVPDGQTDYDGFFEINEWPDSLTDGTYSVTAALDDGTNTFTLTKDLTLNACE